jgi:hypothetical protein
VGAVTEATKRAAAAGLDWANADGLDKCDDGDPRP